MMSKQEHIQYWIKSANEDWDAVSSLFESKKYVHCLFFAHLVLEKWCKAHWVKDNENNTPPKTHNLVKLVSETKIELTETTIDFLREFNDFQLESRYPDYMFEINKRCNLEYTKLLLENVSKIVLCLQEKMQ